MQQAPLLGKRIAFQMQLRLELQFTRWLARPVEGGFRRDQPQA
jgi:hypothetical protein